MGKKSEYLFNKLKVTDNDVSFLCLESSSDLKKQKQIELVHRLTWRE